MSWMPTTLSLPARVKDITGMKFGRLSVTSYAGTKYYGKWKGALWQCLCSCGKKVEVVGSSLRKGNTLSCGCLGKEIRTARLTKHGQYGTILYNTWQNMRRRCNDAKNKSWSNYGGRGIKCLWPSFETFYKDMKRRWRPGLTIERKNNDGHYCKRNCSWTNRMNQCNNKRNNRRIYFKGKTKTLAQWCRILNLAYGRTSYRIRQLGWTPEKALTTPNPIF